mmetsp:Transcript_48566/g.135727  ORF Transcript_48566/g.135727 Transcript_48566/m.135727 type:complete len:229 (+) Transcript_48566:89-775(+)
MGADQMQIMEMRHRQCVEELYDEYADEFEGHLVSGLRYNIPDVLRQKVPQRRYERCLDLGCGTGLAGQAFHDLCGYLEGVDLSQNMISKAEEKGIYDQLQSRDLVAHLRRQPAASFDLLVSADVLIYVYSLEQLFREARRVLSPGGIFAFSTESATEEESRVDTGFGIGVVERTSERFAHARSFILSLVDGFEVYKLDEVPVRLDGRTATEANPILGDVVVLRRLVEE